MGGSKKFQRSKQIKKINLKELVKILMHLPVIETETLPWKHVTTTPMCLNKYTLPPVIRI
jgi:hypothetical protein